MRIPCFALPFMLLTLAVPVIAAAPLTGSKGQVHPPSARSTPRQELGAAIRMLMPPTGTQPLEWDFLSDAPIDWLTDGYASRGTDYHYRKGLLRVDVLGRITTVLRKRKMELAWVVEFSTGSPPKMGVETIKFEPGDGVIEACFGSVYDNCWFDPRPSMERAGIGFKQLCSEGNLGNGSKLYALSAPGKAPMRLKWTMSEGSGGAGAWIELAIATSEYLRTCR